MLAGYLGREDWLSDPRFATPEAQRENFDALHEEVARELATRDAAELEQEMSERGIPCGMVRRVSEAAGLAGEGALDQLALSTPPAAGRAAIPNAGFRMMPAGPETHDAAPLLDEDGEEILAWLAASESN